MRRLADSISAHDSNAANLLVEVIQMEFKYRKSADGGAS